MKIKISAMCGGALFLIWALSIAGSAASSVREEFKVTEVFLKADDGRPSGPCPLRVVFSGYITANGRGTVKYTFTRNDGATGPVHIMEFKQAGRQAVTTDWTLGDATVLPRYAGWQAVKVLSPVEIESSHETGSFEINCGSNPRESGAELPAAYESMLSQITAPNFDRFKTDSSKLNSLNEELQLKLDRAPKSANFDKRKLQEEFKTILQEKDRNKLEQRVVEFQNRYDRQFTEQLQSAGIDLATERQRMASLIGLEQQQVSPEAYLNGRRMLAVGTVSEFVDDRPPLEAAPEFYEDVFAAPFTRAESRAPGSANNRAGTLTSDADSPWNLGLSPRQNLAFVGQSLSTRPGARRLRISVSVNDLDVYVRANAVWGFASAEFAITLRVFDGARVVASRRVPVERFAATFVGFNSLNRRLSPITLGCEFERTPTAAAGNYWMVVEFETFAGSSGFADARSYGSGRVGPFIVRTY
jgi:hypothetical protein